MEGGERKMLKWIPAVMLTAAVMTGCASSGLVHDKEYLRAVSVRGIAEKEMTFSFFSDETMTVSASGKDIEEALEKAELKAGKPVFTGYTELVIVGECEYEAVLGELLNNWKVSPSCRVVYSRNGEKLLRENQAEQLSGRIKQAVKQGEAPESDIITVLGELLSSEGSAVIPEMSSSGEEITCRINRQ